MSCEPNDLIRSAQCILQCIPPGAQLPAQTAMLDLINGGPTPTNTLIENAKQFIFRVPPRMQVPLQIYLLLVSLEGTNRTVDELLRSASCMRCIPRGFIPPVQTNEYCQWSEGGTGGCSNPIVLDWLQRMANNGVTLPSAATIRAVCDFCNDLDVYGLTDKMLVVNPVIPDSLSSMRYPLIWQPANGLSPFINANYLAADLSVNGIQGHGIAATADYFDTGFVPRTHWGIDTTTAGCSVYMASTNIGVPVDPYDIGSTDATTFFLKSYSPTTGTTDVGCYNVASQVAFAHGQQLGFYSMNRISNTLFSTNYGNDTTFGNLIPNNPASQVGVAIPNVSAFFLNNNTSGAGVNTQNSGHLISFMAIHEGLTFAEDRDLFNAVQSLRKALGGGWV